MVTLLPICLDTTDVWIMAPPLEVAPVVSTSQEWTMTSFDL